MGIQFVSPRELAAALGISEARLAAMRQTGKGPAYVKVSDAKQGAVRYSTTAIAEWLSRQAVGDLDLSGLDAAGIGGVDPLDAIARARGAEVRTPVQGSEVRR